MDKLNLIEKLDYSIVNCSQSRCTAMVMLALLWCQVQANPLSVFRYA